MSKLKVYFASPLGFDEAGRQYAKYILQRLEEKRVVVLNPWSQEIGDTPDYYKIGRNNIDMIKECDIVFSVLDGVDVDSGTASEIGYAVGLNKQCFGLRTDWRRTGESFTGVIVNLQVQTFIEYSGGEIFSTFDDFLKRI